MFKLDNDLLQELGLGSLPAHEKNKMLSHIYETLEMRVGMKLAEQMTNEQLDEFESYIDRNDETGALKWLESNFPNYKQVVADELDKLKNEIKTAAPQIVAASLAEQQANPQPPMSQPPQQTGQPQMPPTMMTPQQTPGQPMPTQQPTQMPIAQTQQYQPPTQQPPVQPPTAQ
jgi:NAD+--asparagine ADP-ribosyltransferase